MNFPLVLNNMTGTFIPFLNRASAAAAFHFILCLVHLSERWLYSLNSVLILFYSLSLAMQPVVLNSFFWIVPLFSQNFRVQNLFLVPYACLSHNVSNTASRGSNQVGEGLRVLLCKSQKSQKKKYSRLLEEKNQNITFASYFFPVTI